MRPLFALFSEELLHDAVTADADLQQTRGVATVVVAPVAVIALFPPVQDTVSADRSCGSNKAAASFAGAVDALSVPSAFVVEGAGRADAVFTVAVRAVLVIGATENASAAVFVAEARSTFAVHGAPDTASVLADIALTVLVFGATRGARTLRFVAEARRAIVVHGAAVVVIIIRDAVIIF